MDPMNDRADATSSVAPLAKVIWTVPAFPSYKNAPLALLLCEDVVCNESRAALASSVSGESGAELVFTRTVWGFMIGLDGSDFV